MRTPQKYTIGQDLGRLVAVHASLAFQLLLAAAGLWPAIWLVRTFSFAADAGWKWVLLILGATLTFIYGYFLALLAARLVVPYPAEGYFPRGASGRPPWEMIVYMVNVHLSKARYEPPWTQAFGHPIVNTFPLRLLYRRFFGPHGHGILPGNLTFLPDPYLVYTGRGVLLGGGVMIACHVYDQRGFYIKRVVIEDDATVGGWAVIGPGVKIGKGAMIQARSAVGPNTQVGPYEYWAGDPARFVKKIKPPRGTGFLIDDDHPT